jgi:hypothetical protein
MCLLRRCALSYCWGSDYRPGHIFYWAPARQLAKDPGNQYPVPVTPTSTDKRVSKTPLQKISPQNRVGQHCNSRAKVQYPSSTPHTHKPARMGTLESLHSPVEIQIHSTQGLQRQPAQGTLRLLWKRASCCWASDRWPFDPLFSLFALAGGAQKIATDLPIHQKGPRVPNCNAAGYSWRPGIIPSLLRRRSGSVVSRRPFLSDLWFQCAAGA